MEKPGPQDLRKTIIDAPCLITARAGDCAANRDLIDTLYRPGENVLILEAPEASAALGDLASLETIVPSKTRFTVGGFFERAADITERSFTALIQSRLRLPAPPRMPDLVADIRDTLNAMAGTMDPERRVNISLLLGFAPEKPGKWHLDTHLPADHIRCVRNLSIRGMDIALSGSFNRAGLKTKDFKVGSHRGVPTGYVLFDGGHTVHRSSALDANNDAVRWAYVITGRRSQPGPQCPA